jgi:uncharacterized protein (TIGR03083 family)
VDRTATRAELSSALEALVALARGLDSSAWDRPSPNEEWTALDTLAHVVAAEEGMRARIERALGGDGSLRGDFDLDRWNRRQVEKRRGLGADELLAAFVAEREATMRQLDGVSDAQLSAPVEHPANRNATVGWVFARIAEHQRAHTDDIRRAVGEEDSRRGPAGRAI